MQAINRNLMAIALTAALASPLAVAQETAKTATPPTTTVAPVKAGTTTAGSVKAGEKPVSPTLPTQTSTQASDAISDRTAKQESKGSDATASTSTSTTTTMGSGATGSSDSAKTTNPGKGNWWADADADGDGKLSTTEAAANAGLNSRFTTIDTDKDGFVTQDEYRTFFTANASQGEQNAAAHSMVVTRDAWLKLDGDSDSKISLAEAAANADLSGAFTTIDSNKDGFVTQDEYRAYSKKK